MSSEKPSNPLRRRCYPSKGRELKYNQALQKKLPSLGQSHRTGQTKFNEQKFSIFMLAVLGKIR